MSPQRFLFTLCLAVVLIAPIAAAELELTPTVGYRFDGYGCAGGPFAITGPAIFPAPVCSSVRAESEDGWVVGLVLAVDLSRNLQLELLTNRQEGELTLTTDAQTLGEPRILLPLSTPELTVIHLQVGLARTWGEGRVRPFVAGAVGGSRVESDDPQRWVDFEDDVPSASLGAGAKVYFGDRLGWRVEGRGYWIDLPSELGGDFTQGDATLGLILRF